jgi:hypothetical protein
MCIAEGRTGRPRIMSVGLHGRISGRPGNALGLQHFMEYVKYLGSDIWVCKREDIARFWYARNFPVGEGRPIVPNKAD